MLLSFRAAVALAQKGGDQMGGSGLGRHRRASQVVRHVPQEEARPRHLHDAPQGVPTVLCQFPNKHWTAAALCFALWHAILFFYFNFI